MKKACVTLAAFMGGRPRFKSNWLLWRIDRPGNGFRVQVVEPRASEPTRNILIFWAALQVFIPQPKKALALDSERPGSDGNLLIDRFDLLTFPEAFLPAETLVDALSLLGAQGPAFGCVHTGLRPTDDISSTHLFEARELRDLVRRLRDLPSLEVADLDAFDGWLDEQPLTERFNVACLFTIDAARRIRVCLHPKLVRSKFEVNSVHERHMKEANLLSLVTLQPTDPELPSVTIQPLICSDILSLDTDEPNNHPIPAISTHRSCFSQPHADDVDLVSVVTWSPNTERPGGTIEWHQKFREAFQRSAAGEQSRRHRNAAFVLSNFRFTKAPSEAPGGLSGIFMPVPLTYSPYDAHVSTARCIYGRFPALDEKDEGGEDERWVSKDARWPERNGQPVLGYIVGLDPKTHLAGSIATMFGFTVSRLPRDTNGWARSTSVANFAFFDARLTDDGAIQFQQREAQ
jgi:hypothetical protein